MKIDADVDVSIALRLLDDPTWRRGTFSHSGARGFSGSRRSVKKNAKKV